MMRRFLKSVSMVGCIGFTKIRSALTCAPRVIGYTVASLFVAGYSAFVGALLSLGLMVVATMLFYLCIYSVGLALVVFGGLDPDVITRVQEFYWNNWVHAYMILGALLALLKLADFVLPQSAEDEYAYCLTQQA